MATRDQGKAPRLSDLRTEEHKNYSDVRGGFRVGDILLFQGECALSRVIRWLSHGPYSHSALLAPAWDNRLLVMQAEATGVEMVPSSLAVDRYGGKVEWWALKEEHRQQLDAKKFFTAMLDAIGKPYGFARLLWLGLLLVLNRRQYIPDRKTSSYFCSQYVASVLDRSGVKVDRLGEAGTTPTDFAQSGFFEYKATLHRGP